MNNTLAEQLTNLRLTSFGAALEKQQAQPQPYQGLTFIERLSLLLDEEISQREQRKIERLIKQPEFTITIHNEPVALAGQCYGMDGSSYKPSLRGTC